MPDAFSQLVRNHLPRLDPRSDDDLARDLNDEFAFHLDQIERELVEAGASHEDAQTQSRERFGDIERVRLACEIIARKERAMLQKVNLVLMLVVLVVVVAAAWQMFVTQRYNTLALQAINTQLADMELQSKVEEQGADVVYISTPNKGEPSTYAIPPGGGMTLSRLLNSLSPSRIPVSNYNFTITRGTGENVTHQSYVGQEIADNQQNDPVLQQGDKIYMERVHDDSRRSVGMRNPMGHGELARYVPGDWVQVDAQGTVIENGITMTLLDPEELTNLFSYPQGEISFPFTESKVRIEFGLITTSGPATVDFKDRIDEPGYLSHGPWKFDEETRTIAMDLQPVAPDDERLADVVLFRKVGEDAPASSHQEPAQNNNE